jgi:hypothetical protein
MKNAFIAFVCICMLAGCNNDASLSKKVPGWYDFESKFGGGTIFGKVTYYKNGEMKYKAKVKSDASQSAKAELDVTLTGTWKVEKGLLKEVVTTCKTIPVMFGDTLFAAIKKEEKKSLGNKIIQINKQEMQYCNLKGDTVTYKRISK